MNIIRWTLILLCLFQIIIYPVTGHILFQYQAKDTGSVYLNGKKTIKFALFSTDNITITNTLDGFCDPNITLWCEETTLTINQGVISHILGLANPISYRFFKMDNLKLGVYIDKFNQDDTGEYLLIPVASVPATFHSQYSDVTAEIENTSDWLTIDKQYYRFGINTLNPSNNLSVMGTINVTSLLSNELLSSRDAQVEKVDYQKLVNVDDYSLSPYDKIDTPTFDVVFVGSNHNVGISVADTENIKEKLHINGNILIENTNTANYIGKNTNIEIYDSFQLPSISLPNVPQFIWDSKKVYFRAGQVSGNQWSHANSGEYSVSFGQDNISFGLYSFSAGKENIVTGNYSIIGSGKKNRIRLDYSGILSGTNNVISYANHSFISGGNTNIIGRIGNAQYSSILGGANNSILQGKYNSIVGGKNHSINNSGYSLLLGENTVILSDHDNVFLFGGDSTQCSINSPCDNYSNHQFIIYAKNGLGLGTGNVNNIAPQFALNKPKLDTFTVANNSLRTFGDIIAIDALNRANYVFGDARYMKNIDTAWDYDDTSSLIIWATGNSKVGIGSHLPNRSLHLITNQNQTGILRIEDINGSMVDYYSDSIESNNGLIIKNNSASSINISSLSQNTTIQPKLIVGSDLNSINFSVNGNSLFKGIIHPSNLSSNGTITAEYFAGDGSRLENTGSHFINYYQIDGITIEGRRIDVKRDANGLVGIGTATSNPTSMVHIGNTSGGQLTIVNTGISNDNRAIFNSSDGLSIEFYLDDNGNPSSIADNHTIFELTASGEGIISGGGNRKIIDAHKDGSMLFNIAGKTMTINGTVDSYNFSGDGSALFDIQLSQHNNPQQNVVTFNQSVKILETLTVKKIFTNNLNYLITGFNTSEKINSTRLFVGSDSYSDLTNLSVTGNSLFIGQIEAEGVSANGIVTAVKLSNGGHELNGIQLTEIQTNIVTFSASVSAPTVNSIQAIRTNSILNFTCNSGDEGSIYTKDLSIGGVDICVCTDGTTSKSLINNGVCGS